MLQCRLPRCLRHLPRPRPAIGWLLCAAALVVAGCGGSDSSSRPRPPRPNIVFILVDTLRADRLGCYGHSGGYETPVMDSIAAEGVLFEHAMSPAPWTLPSVPSILTSVHPSVHRVINARNLPGASDDAPSMIRALPDELTTLAEVLQTAGYATAAFSANPFVMAKYGFGQGFDSFEDSFAANHASGSLVNKGAFSWLASRPPDRPFFLYLHYMDVHAPYYADEKHILPLLAAVERTPHKRPLPEDAPRLPPLSRDFEDDPRHQKLRGYVEYWRACYDAGVPQVDDHLGRLRTGLMRMGVWDNAWVILVADHGEALGEHVVWAHGDSIYHNELHVPLVLRWPEKLPAGRRIAARISLMDLLPTMLELLELPVPAQAQGRSLCGLLAGQTPASAAMLAEGVKRRPQVMALVRGGWKLVSYGDVPRHELYRLDDDPGELNDLSDQQAALTAELAALIEQQSATNELLARGIRAAAVPITPEDFERLQALGYLLDQETPTTRE